MRRMKETILHEIRNKITNYLFKDYIFMKKM